MTGADVLSLADALARDPRIGGAALRPGLGFGGGCLPKDIRALAARAAELGVDQALSFLHEIDAINRRRRTRLVDLAREAAGGRLEGRRVGVLGLAFKPGPTTSGTRPRWRWRRESARWAPGWPRSTRPRWNGPGGCIPTWITQARCSARRATPTSCCCSPSGRSSAPRIRGCWRRPSRGGPWWMRGTPSTRPRGRPAGGTTAHRDAPAPPRTVAASDGPGAKGFSTADSGIRDAGGNGMTGTEDAERARVEVACMAAAS